MEQLKYTIADKTIAYLLGVNNYISDESALLEIIKNSYDAGALNVRIIFEDDSITIIDDGKGMNKDDIINHWMNVGESEKIDDYEIMDINNKSRVLSGSKGVGRFALARLGENVRIVSKKDSFNTIIWKTNWDKSYLDESSETNNRGTKIEINNLYKKVTKKRVESIKTYLSKAILDDSMKITIEFDEMIFEVSNCFVKPKLGINCLHTITLNYTAKDGLLLVNIESDEFLDDAKKYCKDTNIHKKRISIKMIDELAKRKMEPEEIEHLEKNLLDLGSFKAEFYFNMSRKISDEDVEKFLYKHKMLAEPFSEGVSLYRNAFIITPYDQRKDWLDLGKRSRKSPAAASHPSGAWRVRSNQISGKVLIDRMENESLIELSNRQGLDENIFYNLFIEIIDTGISEFERYRQSIIRQINKKNTVVDNTNNTPMLDKFLTNPSIINSIEKSDIAKFALELKNLKQSRDSSFEEYASTEKKYKYDVRILNVLATIGLKASSIAHELDNDRDIIDEIIPSIISTLQNNGIWDSIIYDADNSEFEHENVPELLNSQKFYNQEMVKFIDAMLTEIEKKQFNIKEIIISEVMSKIIKKWENDYDWVSFESHICDESIISAEDIFQVVFDNLILNSIQQNDDKSELHIKITMVKENDRINVLYSDNGIGLYKKYENDPKRILEVHETTRDDGHGLGMWIVNNTIIMTGGSIENIYNNNGFHIDFTFGGEIQ